jgi:hypothetical protein
MARKRMGPILQQLGLQASEIGYLSAADLSAMSAKGNLSMALAEARGKAQAAQQKAAAEQAAMAEKRAYESQQGEAKRAAEMEDFKAKNDITAPQALERARTIGGMASGRQIQGALLQDELQRKRAEEAEQRKVEAEQREGARKKREEAEKASRDTDAKLLNEEIALDRIEQKLRTRSSDDVLPGSEGAPVKMARDVKKFVFGGTGTNPEDASLGTDLTAGGLQGYMSTAGNAPNSEREQVVADELLRGNGTVEGALLRVQEKKRELAARKAALKARAQATAARPSSDPDEAALGIMEDSP